MQYLLASTLITSYFWLCWWFMVRPRSGLAPDRALLDADASPLLVAYASQSGRAEALARLQADHLQPRHTVALLPLNQVDDTVMSRVRCAVFVVSTYGEGEAPDNALRFARRWLGNAPPRNLSHLRFAVLALGDSSYQQFCGFGTALEQGLRRHGASPLFATVTMDGLCEDTLRQWHDRLREHNLAAEQPAAPALRSTEAPARRWRLAERRHLNPGSPGAGAYHLRLTPCDGADFHWQAGDIAEVVPGNDPDAPIREYSIASIPEDGSLDLLVRRVCKHDGSHGLGSGWLTSAAPCGSALQLRIRTNPSFHAPDPDRPLVLIGNGTGLAGLRAHLRAREIASAHRNWLLFGERTARHDGYFGQEIIRWKRSGHLERLDLVFSRDQPERRYVQHVLAESAVALREWLEDGAAIYVCGSLHGMAPAVHGVLETVLGNSGLEALVLEGRYRRDIY